MNIAILVKEFPPNIIGGTETQTKRMARELNRNSHNVTVYTKAYPETPDDSTLPYDIIRVPNWRLSPFISTLTFVLAATLLLIREADNHDLLQCMMIYPNGFVGRVVNRITGLPYFAWVRGGDYYFMKDTPGKRWTIDRVLRDTLVLVQTEQIARDVRSEFPETNLQILGNGVDIPDETAEGDDLVFVGRLKEQKGVHVLLRALGGLDERLIVVGDGPERERLESLAQKLNVEVEFVGEVNPNEVADYLRKGKTFILPSIRGEGLPNAVLEAMAVGLPVVVTNTGGAGDAVKNGETGFVVETRNEEELKKKIRQLCESDGQRARMGKAAREWVIEYHSWGYIMKCLDAVYDQCSMDGHQT